jgi:NAD(P)-dependent dehydrogenase (short-subunit alcohol dehydrogenase family)
VVTVAVVVITGCSSGFGLATSLAFARRGERVYATMRDLGKAHDLRAAADAEGLHIEVLALDVTNDGMVQRAVDHVLATEGRIDVLVNNAGIAHWGSVESMPDDLARATFETNVLGAVRMARAVLPGMRAQGSGVIVNVSSVAGRLPGIPSAWAYSASKHALGALSDALAVELEPFGIRVVSIEPGFFSTALLRKAPPPSPGSPYEGLERGVRDYFERSVADGGDPGVVAQAIVRAATDPATGIHVPVGEDAELLIRTAATRSEAEWMAMGRNLFGLAPV